jgi:hypothetical protein
MAMTPHPEIAADFASPGTLLAPPDLAGGPQAADKPRSMFKRGWEVFAENRLALVGLGFVIFVLLFSFVGPMIYKTQQVSVTWRTRTARRARSICSAVTTWATTWLAGSCKAGRARWRSAWPRRSSRACLAPSTVPSPDSRAASWTRS